MAQIRRGRVHVELSTVTLGYPQILGSYPHPRPLMAAFLSVVSLQMGDS